MAFHEEGVISRAECLAGRDDTLQQRAKDIPDLAPHLGPGAA
jgi:hypothetical protein